MRVREVVGLVAAVASFSGAQRPPTYDLVVYGGTSAGVIAAVQAKRMGKTVVIVGPDTHLGGLSSGGLGFTDTGNKAVIGGLSREFYHRVWQHYQRPDAWKWQKREEYGNKGQGTPAIDGEQRTMWIFEPHVAEQVFEDLVREHRIPVHRDEWLDRAHRRHQGREDASPSITTLERADLRGTDVHRRDLRGRSDGRGRRRVSRRARGAKHLRREVERRADRCAAPSPSLRRAARRRSAPTSCRAIRRAACCRASAPTPPGEFGQGRQADPGLLLPHVPDRPSRQPHSVSEAGRLRPEAVRAAAADLRGRLARDVREVRSAFPTARPTPTITARSAPTTSGSTTTIPRPPTSGAARS